MSSERFCDLLVERGYASPAQIKEALKFQATTGGDVVQILISLGVDSRHAYECRAQSLGVPFVDLTAFKPDRGAIAAVPLYIARRHNVLPVKRDGNILYVAMADPNDVTACDDLTVVSECTVRGILADPSEIREAIGREYG